MARDASVRPRSVRDRGGARGGKRPTADPLEREIEAALDPGWFVSDGAEFSFVSDLGEVQARVGQLVDTEPARAVSLFETFFAACCEKAEEVDDSSDSFGDFAGSLIGGWVAARQASGAAADETAARLLAWMDDDDYGFCNHLERHVAPAFSKTGLAAFIDQVRARFDAARSGPGGPGETGPTNYARRRWADVLRTLYAAQRNIDAYVAVAEETGLTPRDCHTVATILVARRRPDEALSWVQRGVEQDAATPHGSSARLELTQLRLRLLKKLGRDDEALQTAWNEYRAHSHIYTYDALMKFVPDAERPVWREKAIVAALGGTHVGSVMELLLHTKELDRLAQLVGRSTDEALEAVSHHVAQPAAGKLEKSHAREAARIWRAQGVRILKDGKSKHYNAALSHFEQAKRCYERAGLHAEWRAVVAEVQSEHHRRRSFIPSFERLASGSGPARSRTSWTGRRRGGPSDRDIPGTGTGERGGASAAAQPPLSRPGQPLSRTHRAMIAVNSIWRAMTPLCSQ